jgi:CHAT domain-containing protein
MSIIRLAAVIGIAIFAISGHAVESDSEKDSTTLTKQARTLINEEKYNEAIILLNQALHSIEEATSLKDIAIADILDNIAEAYSRAGEWHRAIPNEARALQIRESNLGGDHLTVGISLENLAGSYYALENYTPALVLQTRALSILERNLPDNDAKLADSLNLLSKIYRGLNKNEQVVSTETRALTINERSYGTDSIEAGFNLNNIAIAQINLDEYEKAILNETRALRIFESAWGKSNPGIAKVLTTLAVAYSSLNQFTDAELLQRRALDINEAATEPDNITIAENLTDLARTLRKQGKYQQAIALQLRTIDLLVQSQGPKSTAVAKILIELTGTLNKLGNYQESMQAMQRVVNIVELAFGPNTDVLASTLVYFANNLGDNLARHGEAIEYSLRAAQILENILGPNDIALVPSLQTLSRNYNSSRNYGLALEYKQRELTIVESAYGSNHPDIPPILSSLSQIYGDLGDLSQALNLGKKSLLLSESINGKNNIVLVNPLINLARIYDKLGNYEGALSTLERALAINESALNSNSLITKYILNTSRYAYARMGNHDKALIAAKRALDIQESELGKSHPELAPSLVELSTTYSNLEMYEEAIATSKRAAVISETVWGNDSLFYSLALANLAISYYESGEYESALTTNQAALKAIEKSSVPDHPYSALVLDSLALTLFKIATTQGDISQLALALNAKQRSLKIKVISVGADNLDVANDLATVASFYAGLNNNNLAIAYLKLSVNTLQTRRKDIGSSNPQFLNDFTKKIQGPYQSLANILTVEGRLLEAQLVLDMLKEDEQFEFIRRSEKSDPRNTRIGYNQGEKAWVDRYQEISDKLAALGAEDRALKKQAAVGLTSDQVQRQKVIAADLKVAQAAFESFLSQMTGELARGGPARSGDLLETSEKALAELRDLLKSLGDGVVLLQLYVTDDQVNFLLTTPGVQLARSSKIKVQDLNRQIAQFRRELRDPKSDPRPAAQAMYQLLIGPVAQDLEQAGAKTVMLSLDGALRYLPFSALHDGKTYLNQRYSLPIYTSVAKSKLREGASPQWQAVGLGVTRKLGDFDPLPGVKSEMNGIVRTAGGGALPGEVYLDEAFTAQRLRDVSQRNFPVMHVASHFRFSPGTEANSFLLLGDGSQLTLGDIRTQNYRFDNVDLLTLSACETGLGGGRDATGKEIEGFGVIAQQQGGKAVLATLWPVADQSTALLMADMYRKRQGQSLNKAEALRQAQIALQEQPQYAHPYYWAPFILMGNWK